MQARINSERQYVSSYSDIVENSAMLRGLGADGVRTEFGKDTAGFAASHFEALKYTVSTKEYIELAQGAILAIIFLFTSYLVTTGAV
jgi:hypothetical protein